MMFTAVFMWNALFRGKIDIEDDDVNREIIASLTNTHTKLNKHTQSMYTKLSKYFDPINMQSKNNNEVLSSLPFIVC